MAHELGHLLGCPHDSERYPGFSSRHCPWSDGYMMTYLSNSSNSMKFSKCCNQAITTFVMTTMRTCLLTRTGIRNIKKAFETHKLPGDVVTRDDFCRLSFPDISDIRFATENGTARCYATCYSVSKTLGIVYPCLIESRNDGGEKVIKISESITLKLKKSSVVSKEFLLRTYQDDIMEHNYIDGEILEQNLYHDAESFASVIVLHEDGLKVEGIMSSMLGIKPMTTRERSANGSIPHAFYELPREKPNDKTPPSHLEKIVFPELIEVRDISAEKVLKITEDLTLYLEKSSVLAKEFLLRTYDGRLMQHTYLDGESLEENLYHDLRSLSSVMVSQESGLKVVRLNFTIAHTVYQ
ncbi:hypothetical protein MRX96_056343 [Rhipicephalus microplus]